MTHFTALQNISDFFILGEKKQFELHVLKKEKRFRGCWIKMGDPVSFNFGEVVGLKAGEAINSINSNYSVMSELVGGAWELEPDHFADVSLANGSSF